MTLATASNDLLLSSLSTKLDSAASSRYEKFDIIQVANLACYHSKNQTNFIDYQWFESVATLQ